MKFVKKEIGFLTICFFVAGAASELITRDSESIGFVLSDMLFPILVGYLFSKEFSVLTKRSFFSCGLFGFLGSLSASVPLVVLFLLSGFMIDIIPFVFLRAVYVALFFAVSACLFQRFSGFLSVVDSYDRDATK